MSNSDLPGFRHRRGLGREGCLRPGCGRPREGTLSTCSSGGKITPGRSRRYLPWIGLAVSDDGLLLFAVHPLARLLPSPATSGKPVGVAGRLRGPPGGRISRRWSWSSPTLAFDGKVGTSLRGDIGRPPPLDQARPRLCIDTVCAALVQERLDRDLEAGSGGRLVAARTNGRFWMYWGEGTGFAATSEDLVRWTPVEFDATRDRYLSDDPSATGPGTSTSYRARVCSGRFCCPDGDGSIHSSSNPGHRPFPPRQGSS